MHVHVDACVQLYMYMLADGKPYVRFSYFYKVAAMYGLSDMNMTRYSAGYCRGVASWSEPPDSSSDHDEPLEPSAPTSSWQDRLRAGMVAKPPKAKQHKYGTTERF